MVRKSCDRSGLAATGACVAVLLLFGLMVWGGTPFEVRRLQARMDDLRRRLDAVEMKLRDDAPEPTGSHEGERAGSESPEHVAGDAQLGSDGSLSLWDRSTVERQLIVQVFWGVSRARATLAGGYACLGSRVAGDTAQGLSVGTV